MSASLKEVADPINRQLRVLRSANAARGPFIVFWELTQACQLACKHCRASAMSCRDPAELSTELGIRLLDELASFKDEDHAAPLVVLTGGDPLERGDLAIFIEEGVRRGLEMALTPSATPLLTRDAMARLRDAGLSRIALSLDGAVASTHDGFRGVAGSYERTRAAMRWANELDMPLQINSTMLKTNEHELEALAALLAGYDVALWSLFFLVPVGRGQAEQRLSAQENEALFVRIAALADILTFPIKTTEAPHYRRFVLMSEGRAALDRLSTRAPLGITDGKGTLFVGHRGEIYPSGFLPLLCGRFPEESVVDIYQRHPQFRDLRNSDQLKGKCGACNYRHVCGGSRARAYAVTGDPLASEPDCAYVPPGYNAPADAPKHRLQMLGC